MGWILSLMRSAAAAIAIPVTDAGSIAANSRRRDGHDDCWLRRMNASDDSRDAEAEIFHAFGLACRAERDRLSLARLEEQDRRFEHGAIDRAIAELFVDRLIATISRP